MKGLIPYLNFDGDAKEAMEFYAKCLDANVDIQTFKDASFPAPPGAENRVIHARLTKGGAVLMASDTQPGTPFTKGNNLWVNIDCDSVEEQDRMFNGLAEGGQVLMALENQFWGARFGMLSDKYGVNWMLNCELPK